MDLGLRDKAVIVTGAGSDVGRAIALGFAREGASFTLADVDEELAQEAAALAREAGADAAEVVRCDVTRLDQIQAMFTRIVARCATVDVLVNNEGWDRFTSFKSISSGCWTVRGSRGRCRRCRAAGSLEYRG